MKMLFYLDSIHYSETLSERGKNDTESTVQISLLSVPFENEKTTFENEVENEKVIDIPVSKLMFANDTPVKENNFVYYDSAEIRLENGNNDTMAKSLIRKAAYLRDAIKESSQDRVIEIPTDSNYWKNVTSYHVNVGHGNCSILLFERDRFYTIWMVDCGTSRFARGLQNIDSCFSHIAEHLNVDKGSLHISLFMLTHLHNDHYNGIEWLFEQGYCNGTTAFYYNQEYAVASPKFVKTLQCIQTNNCIVKTPIRNIHSGFEPMAILYPDRIIYKNKPVASAPKPNDFEPKANNASAIYLVSNKNNTMMFPGDMERKELDKMTQSGNCTPYLCMANFYCVSHHASITGHLDCKCLYSSHPFQTCLQCCQSHLDKAIIMGKNGAFNGIYSVKVINDFKPNVVYSEKDTNGIPVKCLILDWNSRKCSYIY